MAVAVGGLAVAEAPREAPQVERLLTELSDERYPVRERATAELWALGDEILPAIEAARENADPETAARAQEIWRRLRLGITPESPRKVVNLVLRYEEADPEERQRIIGKLKEERAWPQVLKMHALERDPETLEEIADEIAGVAVEAAREMLAREPADFGSARELLEMARPEPAQLMTLAEFHRIVGSLDEELEKARGLEGEAGHRWRLALLTAAGELEAAVAEAEALGDDATVARLRLLLGDPVPWFEQGIVPQGELPADTIEAYRDAVIGLWRGREVPRGLVRGLAAQVRDEFSDESWHSLGILFGLGEVEWAEPRLAGLSPAMAFAHFNNLERVDSAHRALGLDPERPNYADWCERRFAVLLEDYHQSEHEVAELVQLGAFFESRGMDERLREWFVPPLVELGEREPETFVEVMQEMFAAYSGARLVLPVIESAAAYAGDDAVRWSTVLETLFGDGPHIRGLWESLEEFAPEEDPGKRFMRMACLFGLRADREGLAADWWRWADERAFAGDESERRERLGLMLALCVVRDDAERFLETARQARQQGLELDALGPYSEKIRFVDFEMLCLGAAGRWDAVVKTWREQVEESPLDPMKRAYLAGSLRRAGEVEAAREHDRMAERLALGEVDAMRRVGQAYASSGDFGRAAEWWRRAAAAAVESDGDFFYVTFLLRQEAKEQGDWPLAAALGEMYLLYQVLKGDGLERPSVMLRTRVEVEMARGFALLEEDPERGMERLAASHGMAATDGIMADFFFPGLRAAGRVAEHDRWFGETFAVYESVLARYPESHNTMNTAAWTASRANRRLADAERLVTRALELQPDQPAYLDTLGEVWFCRGDRDKAVEWSDEAVSHAPGEDSLLRQNERFRSGELPLP